MDRYGGLVDKPGVADGDGESWEAAAKRLRGGCARQLHPLVSEVMADGQ